MTDLRTWARVVPLPFSTPPLHLNQRIHWATAARYKRLIQTAVWAEVSRVKYAPMALPVEVVLHWQPAVKRGRDSDNPTPTLKACIDQLVKCGVIPGDDTAENVTSRCEIHPVGKPAGMWLTIETIQP